MRTLLWEFDNTELCPLSRGGRTRYWANDGGTELYAVDKNDPPPTPFDIWRLDDEDLVPPYPPVYANLRIFASPLVPPVTGGSAYKSLRLKVYPDTSTGSVTGLTFSTRVSASPAVSTTGVLGSIITTRLATGITPIVRTLTAVFANIRLTLPITPLIQGITGLASTIRTRIAIGIRVSRDRPMIKLARGVWRRVRATIAKFQRW